MENIHVFAKQEKMSTVETNMTRFAELRHFVSIVDTINVIYYNTEQPPL